jgi:uncharacterized protein (TIGR03435 family)
MRALWFLSLLLILSSAAAGQAPGTPAFEVASVKPSQHLAGADYNNQLAVSPSGMIARNATLRRLLSQAYGLQARQVIGPSWLDQNEYDIDARAGEPANPERMDLMLRTLLAARFNLKQHLETRVMQVYELRTNDPGKLRPVGSGETAKAGTGLHFRGDMRRFADLVAVRLSIPIVDDPTRPGVAGGPAIPVLDRTELPGIYDLTIDVKGELGTGPFSLWQRALRDQLGLKIESRRGPVEVLIVDEAARIPTAN